jgi:hypothetical protein
MAPPYLTSLEQPRRGDLDFLCQGRRAVDLLDAEIIDTVHGGPAPMVPVTTRQLRRADPGPLR